MKSWPRSYQPAFALWAILICFSLVALIAAVFSPLLQWRDPIYWAASFSGILALVIMLFQPLLVTGVLTLPTGLNRRRFHRNLGVLLVVMIVIHVATLWLTSPPDVIDALLLVSPTPFSLWGVIAMWAIIGAAAMVAMRRALTLRFSTWQRMHLALTAIAVAGTIAHTLLIDGIMEQMSKVALCILAGLALVAGLRARRKRI
ncbi:MAG: ferric reductase-like transmembrane domain-containing protein [Pseudomonadota bacterium]